MGKRFGSYISPTTGEEDWLEPDTVNMIVIQPRMVTRVGETNVSAIDFKLDCTKDEEHITVMAEYTTEGTKYASKQILISSEDFANEFKDIIYADKSLEESALVKGLCDEASQDLTNRLMDNSILMGGMQFAGIGFIKVDGDKVMTLENIDFNYKIENGKGIQTAIIRNCVSQASLNNLENPEIDLSTGTYKVSLRNPKVIESIEGRIKQYTLSIDEIVVVPDTEIPEYKVFDNAELSNEDILEEYIAERSSMLDDLMGNDSDLDDRFDDLFN